MLSFESLLRAFLPQSLLEPMMVFIESSLATQVLNKFLLVTRKCNVYISQFVCAFVQTTPYKADDDAKNLLRYLCQATIDIHEADMKPEAASSFAATYNPPKLGEHIISTRKVLKLEKPESLIAIALK